MASRARLAADRAWSAATLPNYAIQNSDFTAVLDGEYLVDCTGNHVEIILPEATAGRYVNIGDYNGTIGVYNINITTTNSQLIHGSTDDFIVAAPNAVFVMLYIDDTIGWKVVEALGENGMGHTGESIGSIKMWGTHTLPEGWIELDGRTDLSAYPDLVALYPLGLPDMRGRFIAGYSAGGTVAPVLGQFQEGQLEGHAHTTPVYAEPNPTPGTLYTTLSSTFGIGESLAGSGYGTDPLTASGTFTGSKRGLLTGTELFNQSSETFPDNVGLYVIIKAYDTVNNSGRLDFASIDNQVAENTNALAAVSNPNLFTNGDVSVWQRGTTFNGIVAQYTADRFLCANTSGTLNVVQGFGAGAGGQTNGLSFNCNATIGARWNQRVEANVFRAASDYDSITISFWVFSTTGVDVQWSPCSPVVADDWTSGVVNHGDFNIGTLAPSTLTKMQYTIPVTSDFVNGFGGNIELLGTVSGDVTFSKIKLEFGNTATRFHADLPQENLAKCQRYYQRSTVTYPAAPSSTARRVAAVGFPVEMRIAPNVTETVAGDAISTKNVWIDGFRLRWGTGMTANETTITSYTADAEL